MSTSTDGQLSFGIVFEEGFEFPWDESHDGDIEGWWREVNGFVNPVESPFDDNTGWYKPGIKANPEIVSRYFAEQRKWDEENPVPVQEVNYCSGDYPMSLLATKHMFACRGEPLEVDVDSLLDTAEAAKTLKDFIDRFGIEAEGEPRWWLSSYWG